MDLTTEAENRGAHGGRRLRMDPLYAVGVICLLVLSIQAAAIQFTREPKSQDALHGRSAMLRCEVSEPTDITYRWLHNGQPLENSDRRYQEGSNLKFNAVDRQLDAGNFKCVAQNTAMGEVLHSTNASFNIKWLESGGVTLKEPTSEGEIESSAPVTLRCHIDGHPRPTCQWFKDGVKLTEKSHQINNKERTLTIKSATPDDNGLFYCCAKNAAGHVCSNSNFSLNIIDKSFPRPVVTPEDQVVLRNEEAVFHCQFTAVPPPALEWYHESELLVNKTRVFLLSNGSLLITQVKPRNTGLYKCVGRSDSGSQVTHEASLLIAEIDDMMAKMSKVFTADTLQRVPCNAPRGRPQPGVWWEKGGQRVPTEGRVYQDGSDLVFSPTEAGDSGVYTCVAQNKAGRRTQEVTFTVATAPLWVTMPQDSRLEEGKPGYLHCHAKATPEPEVTWLRNNIMITPEDSRFKLFPNGTLRINSVEVYDGQMYGCETKTVGGRLSGQARITVLDGGELPPRVEQKNGQLHFSKVTRSDAGNYTCIASNSLQGEVRALVSLTVAVYIRFKVEPENTTVYQGHTAILHCQATGDPEPHIHWMVKDKTLDISKNRRIQKMPNGSLVISDVTTDNTGRYTCVAGNSCSIKDRVAQLYVVDKPAQTHDEYEERAPYKMIQTIGLSVGAAVAYIIVVLGLMFYCKKRRNAKRQNKRPDGEEPEMECLNGGTVQQNGHTTTEIQEEVALTNMGTMATAEKRHSHVNSDKLHFPRANLQTITTLGKGEFGEVLLSKAKGIEEREEETVVLVKSLQTRDEQLQLDFRREAEMFGKLSHPNVVRLLGLCREAEPHYMVLEYYDLGDLKQFLRISKDKDDKVKAQPISTKTKVSICAQVAHGMEHLSNHRFVHKDLAARNCLVSSQRRVKVSSLSLNKDVYKSEYYHYRQAWIPLRWLPSESVFEDDFSTKSDVWAFGVLMWEVFSHGEIPYSKLGDNEVLEGLQTGKLKLPPPEGCPSKMYKLMVSCWAPSLKERPSFSDIVHSLGEPPSDSKV
ncbi:inactive tyrosine-protein kinase 7 isoform X2 [Phyllopteryx taeniolatus]|uniref:inactive tyrosine-protein kinase 7 isoform X2 n=1 Tax=Phyllopteryx taeniolatus TaxID=161469 RepID=UPI002AD5A2A0|nr:inactive tyrosine-protein kinase 7 isoform X2 [Phyllopteryx taeniolatus]